MINSFRNIDSPKVDRFKFWLALIGAFLSLVLMVVIIQSGVTLHKQSQDFLAGVQGTIDTTKSGLGLLQDSLDSVSGSLSAVEGSMESLGSTLDTLGPMLEHASTLVGTDLVDISRESRTALVSAAKSSELIDGTLELLSRIPLLGLNYKPEVPLSKSLGELGNQLGAVPELLRSIQTDLDATAEELDVFDPQIQSLTSQISDLQTSLSGTQPLIESYQSQLDKLETSATDLGGKLPARITWITFILAGLALWSAATQLIRAVETSRRLYSGKIEA